MLATGEVCREGAVAELLAVPYLTRDVGEPGCRVGDHRQGSVVHLTRKALTAAKGSVKMAVRWSGFGALLGWVRACRKGRSGRECRICFAGGCHHLHPFL